MKADSIERRPHAVLDLRSRRWKALKIEHLLGLSTQERPLKLLEIGTGSGGIAHYFGTHDSLRCEVTAVDVCDQRLVRDGYAFKLVQGSSLPFTDSRFDVVITNHVLEHVGDTELQVEHLREVCRVLRTDGVGYLAVPNRWMVVEPHYRLAFLSWLPSALRTPYLRTMRRGRYYDCNPPSLTTLERMLSHAGLQYENLCIRALRETFAIEGARGVLARLASQLPDTVLVRLSPISPTLIYRVTRE